MQNIAKMGVFLVSFLSSLNIIILPSCAEELCTTKQRNDLKRL